MKLSRLVIIILVSVFLSCGNHKNEASANLPKPSGNCVLVRDDKDPMGKRIRVLDEEKFISLSFSDTSIVKALNGNDFLKGYLSCVAIDTVRGVYFRFDIHSDNAFQYYGMIKKDNKILFILKSGKSVELAFGNTFSGNTDLSKEITEYSAFAPLSKNGIEGLTSEEIVKVKISWSKKDEDYMVVNPSVFINQLACLR